ncbi:MAG: hypothetical protein IJ389_02205 [Clostridia bacterium]|nr:hypothetical protein [Clostridia bacterium]
MTDREFVEKLKKIATDYKTVYVLGCFGAPLTSASIGRYLNAYSYNKGREALLRDHINKGYFGFDCVCLIKAVLWGWNGDAGKPYGGAVYASNGVGDISDSQMIKICTDVSYDFSHIKEGELLYMPGHVGVYIGDGLAVECTPSFSGDVQITACNRNVAGYNRRNWTCHGKLPFIEYTETRVTSLANKALNGENCHRGADMLIKYTGKGKTGTNKWGAEVCIDRHGRAISSPVYGACKLDIPDGGCVLSGHGDAGKWMLENIRAGYTVFFENNRAYVIPCGGGYVSGENIPRATDCLVVYKGKSTTGTNKWGKEAACSKDGRVLEIRPWGVGNTVIPSGGFVLSAHGKSADWLGNNISVGATVGIVDHKVVLR